MKDLLIEGVSKKFGDFKALTDINIEIKKGEFVCFLGPSGCGKTTLLRIIAGLEKADGGSIGFNGRDITNLHPGKRKFGIVFQSYALFPNMTAAENIAYGLKNQGMEKKYIAREVDRVLELVGLRGSGGKYPSEMSGGQQQRIALARAIALSPDLLLLDEPLSALDAKVRGKLRKDIKDLQEKLGITTIMVTHDQEEALTMADKVVVMKNAQVMQVGTPGEIYDKPVNKFVADFIGEINFIEKGGKILAIRPEHILLRDILTEGAETAVLEEWEYMGAFYRLQLSIKGVGVKVDVSSNRLKNIKLKKGINFFVEMDKDHFLEYEGVSA